MNEAVLEDTELKSRLRQKFSFLFDRHSFFYYVVVLVLVGLGFFGYALFTEYFTTPFSGDYSQQAFPFYYNFYDDWWTFFRTGKFPFYDANTFIGADNIQANTYYGLFSPFTFPILFFPRNMIPQAMAICSIAKLVCGGLLFRVYLKYLGCEERTARIFSIAYAFTGWMAYYLWFNTFYEVMAFLPLILFGIEKVLKQKQIWAVSLGFFLMGIGNYFFLLTLGIFGVIYAGFRYFQTFKTRSWKDNLIVIGLGFAGFLLGFAASAVLTGPAILSSFGINRATSAKYWPSLKEAIENKDWDKAADMIFKYWNPSVANNGDYYKPTYYYFAYAFPFVSYLYPTVSCRFVNLVHYSEFENTGSSIFYFTPLIIMLIPCLFRSIKNGKFSHFIALGIILLCLFVPFFYFLCGMFANAYGRWEIVVPVVGITYIALNFDHREEIKPWWVFTGGVVSFAMMITAYFLAKRIIDVYGLANTKIPGGTDFVRYNGPYITEFGNVYPVIIYEMILCVVETTIITKFWWKKYLAQIVRIFIIGEAIVMGNIVANIHSLQSTTTSVMGGIGNQTLESEIIKGINDQDNSFFRIQSTRADESHSNLPAAENYNGISTFHTFYNNNVDDFVHMLQITNHDTSWSGVAFGKHADLDAVLGVKYYMTKDIETQYGKGENATVYEPNVPLNYKLMLQRDGYRVYKNEYHINLGTSFDTLYYKHTREDIPKYNAFYYGGSDVYNYIRNEEVMLKGAILEDADVDEIVRDHPDIIAKDEVPLKELTYVNKTLKGVYANEKWVFDPANTARDIKNESKIADPGNTNVAVNKFQIVYEPLGSTTFPIGEKGGYYLFNYPNRQTWGKDYTAAVWLIDEDDKVITFDECRYNSNNSGYIVRGLYSDRPVKRIIVCPLRGVYFPYSPALYYEPFENTLARMQKCIDNGLTDVTYNVNDFTFKTNYEKERFVTLQLAYTGGWKVKANGQELKIYKSQGGLVGFVAPKGEVYYELSYESPDVLKWAIVSAVAFLGIGASVAIPLIIKKKREDNTSLNIDNK